MVKENLTFIYPVEIYDENVEASLKESFKALGEVKSSKGCKVIITGPDENVEKATAVYKDSICKLSLNQYKDNSKTFFQYINCAVSMCVTKYFMIMEPDNVIMDYWIDVMEECAIKHEDYSLLLPIFENYSSEKKWVSFSNEIPWNTAYAEAELGTIGKEMLDIYKDYSITGSAIKTEDFISYGGFKPSLIVASWYEFLRRFVQNSAKIYVIPKVGCITINDNKNSYMSRNIPSITEKHGEWLIKTSEQECFFKEDRNKVFSEEDTETETAE